ncbi:MAG: response regulator transcription factor [Chloroflexi bacterium]|nr:response regulator transcription factor [Chloroflexota bacterium]
MTDDRAMTRPDGGGRGGRSGPGGPVTVALVEDEPLYRDLLQVALARHPRLRVAGAFADGEAALAALPALRPRVALLDIALPGPYHGVELGLRLRAALPELGIVLLSNHADPQYLAAVPPAAAAGWSYLLKRSVADVETLVRAIAGAAAGAVVVDPAIVDALRPRPGSPLAALRARQRQILALVAQGYTNAAIAERLALAEKTVENQLNLLYRELGVSQAPAAHPRVTATLLYLSESYL